jgi:hypothetical protein
MLQPNESLKDKDGKTLSGDYLNGICNVVPVAFSYFMGI